MATQIKRIAEYDAPTRQQLLNEGLLVAQRQKWEGWNWKEYQKSIVRLNHKVSELEGQIDRMMARTG